MPIEYKLNIRKQIHQDIINNLSNIDNKQYIISDNKFDVTIVDFGHSCPDDEIYDEKFGTQMYQAPEIILLGDCNNKVDIWAAGCILYELIVGEFLFDPVKDKNKSRDYYHLLEMTKVSGGFSKKFLKTTKYSKKYFDSNGDLKDIEYREFYDWDELLEKIEDINERIQVTDLLKKMLSLNEIERINANDILQHPWLN